VGNAAPATLQPSGFLSYGIAAPLSVGVIGQNVVWLARTLSGHTCVVMAQGFTPAVISTPALETHMETYSAIIRAVADVYSDRGHTFYLLHFEAAPTPTTWAWDLKTGLWCERGTWLHEENRYTFWRPRYYAWAYNQHRMLDAAGGSIFHLSADYTTDVDGLYIRRLRRAPAINAENKRVFYRSFELELEPGLGDPTPTVAEFTAAAATVIYGYVTDGDDLLVEGATVVRTAQGLKTTTDSLGYYSFAGVTPGSVQVDASKGGDNGVNTGVAVAETSVRIDVQWGLS
jgi:hypothetical protein